MKNLNYYITHNLKPTSCIYNIIKESKHNTTNKQEKQEIYQIFLELVNGLISLERMYIIKQPNKKKYTK